MNMKERLDPELVEPLENVMAASGGGFDLHRLVETRSMVNAMVAGVKAEVPEIPGIHTEDLRVPGSPGLPPVEVRIYRPAGSSDVLPVLVWMHGGGWVLGNLELDDLMLRQLVSDVGIAVASVGYRLAPENPFPAALDDSYAVVKWLAANGGELGFEPGRIAVGGASAGGGLAAGVALLARDRGEVDLCFQLLIYPSINDRNVEQATEKNPDNLFWSRENALMSWRAYLGERLDSGDIPSYAAAIRARDLAGLPPAYVAVGGLDMFLPDCLEYVDRLTAAAVDTELHVYPGAFHAFDAFAPMAAVSRRFVRDRDDALRRLFGR
jgi:acetyl esterase/lipase